MIDDLLKDAVNAKSISSKNILIQQCINAIVLINDHIKMLDYARSNMVPSPKASENEVKHILKEVGLQDMDDPSYGYGLKDDSKSKSNNNISYKTYPPCSMVTKEDVDAKVVPMNVMNKFIYDSLPSAKKTKTTKTSKTHKTKNKINISKK